MKKEELKKLGLTEELADKVINMHNDEINGAFIPKQRFDEMNVENKSLKAAVKERDRQLERIKRYDADIEMLRKQIEVLQKALSEARKAYERKIVQMKTDSAVEAALHEAGAKNIKAVRSLFDESSFRLLPDGTVYGLAEAIKAVQTSDPYLFRDERPAFEGMKGYQPEGSSGRTMPDITHMTYSQFIAAGGK